MTTTRMAEFQRTIREASELVLEPRLNQLRPGVWSAFSLIVRDEALERIVAREAELTKLRRETAFQFHLPSAIAAGAGLVLVAVTFCVALPILGVLTLAESAFAFVRGVFV